MSAMTWALILISGSMNVSFSNGYPSEKLCKDAMNVAKTGLTIQEEKDRDEKARLNQAIADGQWRMDHPLRKPTEEDKKLCPTVSKNSGSVLGYITSIGSGSGEKNSYCNIEDDGLVHEYQMRFSITGGGSYAATDSVRWAKCVLVNPEDK